MKSSSTIAIASIYVAISFDKSLDDIEESSRGSYMSKRESKGENCTNVDRMPHLSISDLCRHLLLWNQPLGNVSMPTVQGKMESSLRISSSRLRGFEERIGILHLLPKLLDKSKVPTLDRFRDFRVIDRVANKVNRNKPGLMPTALQQAANGTKRHKEAERRTDPKVWQNLARSNDQGASEMSQEAKTSRIATIRNHTKTSWGGVWRSVIAFFTKETKEEFLAPARSVRLTYSVLN